MTAAIAANCTASPFLIGDRLYLRPLERSDIPTLHASINDPEIRAQTGEVLPMNLAGVEAYFERIQKDESRVWFVIVLKENDQVIGEAGLLRMFHAWRQTDLTMIIFDKAAQNQGYGTEAITLLMDYAFGYLNFHRISIGVVGFNERALKFYEKVGFQREGIQRDGYYFNHQYSDFIMMSILEDEFRALHP